MSRKIIYVSGLLACFGCHFDYSAEQWLQVSGSMDGKGEVIRYFEGAFRCTPLEIITGLLLRHAHLDNAARKIIGSYDNFVAILANNDQRKHLEELNEDDAGTDSVYQHARYLSRQFRDGLLELFFDPQSGMDTLTRNYGVF